MGVFTQAPAGTVIKLKLENNAGAETEVDVFTNTSGAWETLTFDYTGQPNVFSSLVFMFDFGAVGDSSTNSTFLFDDITQTNSSSNIGIQSNSQVEGLTFFPNPVKDKFTIMSYEEIRTVFFYDMLGNQISKHYPNDTKLSLDMSKLKSGTYIVRIATDGGLSTKKIIVE